MGGLDLPFGKPAYAPGGGLPLTIVVVAKQVFGGDPLVAKPTNASQLVTLSTIHFPTTVICYDSPENQICGLAPLLISSEGFVTKAWLWGCVTEDS